MIFQGEEYGERAPFQFFSDHIDQEFAVATREGRRREFEFSGVEVPDPQDPATFERSKLTRERDAELQALYAELIRTRRTLQPGDGAVEFDERAGWISMRRGEHTLIGNLSRTPVHVPREHVDHVVLATHEPTLEPGFIAMPPLSGALVR
jgi:maltooligosyltrehalose trehalohydrolase